MRNIFSIIFSRKGIFFVVTVFLACNFVKFKMIEKEYNSGVAFALETFCYDMLRNTYSQYLGPIGDKSTSFDASIGYSRIFVKVYFPNMAPQLAMCSAHFPHHSMSSPINKTTKVELRHYGLDYAPQNFYNAKNPLDRKVLASFEELDKKHSFLSTLLKTTSHF